MEGATAFLNLNAINTGIYLSQSSASIITTGVVMPCSKEELLHKH